MATKKMRPVFKDHPKSKVFLSPIEKEDADRYYQWTNDPEITRFLTSLRFPMTRVQEETWCAGSPTPKLETNVVCAIIDKKSGTHIGSVGLHNINWINRSAITGAMIGDKRYWGRSYGSHAKLLLLRHAYGELGLNSIVSHVFAGNGRSIAYNRKCGYRNVGTLAKHTWREGSFQDEVVMEVLPELFEPVWKRFEAGRFDKKKPRP